MTEDEREERVRLSLGLPPRPPPVPVFAADPAALCDLVAASAFARGLLLATAGWLRQTAAEGYGDWLSAECDAAARAEAAALRRLWGNR